MKNHVSAKGAVVGDVAQDAIERFSMEIATAGNSYVDQQRIAKILEVMKEHKQAKLLLKKLDLIFSTSCGIKSYNG